MRALLLLLIISLFSKPTIAQEKFFELTSHGFVSTQDTTKLFSIYYYEGKSQSELYKKALVYINTLYVSPKDVISNVENETITINGVAKSTIRQNSLSPRFDMNYTIVLMFKDNRIRIDAPTFRLSNQSMGKHRIMNLVSTGLSLDGTEIGIYNKKGNLKLEKAKDDLENFFTSYLIKFHDAIENDKINKEW